MKALKASRYVSFKGYVYSSDVAQHVAQANVAKKLSGTVFAESVLLTEPVKPNEEGAYSSESYYQCDGVMVTDKEFNLLRTIGVKDLTTKGYYQDGVTDIAFAAFWLGFSLFLSWNILVALKFTGILS